VQPAVVSPLLSSGIDSGGRQEAGKLAACVQKRFDHPELQAGRGYTCAADQKHRLIGITDCEVREISMPEIGTTWRFEDDYARPHEAPQQRAIERGETGNK